MSKLIKIIDSGHNRYTLEPETTLLGRQYDDEAETIVIVKPAKEVNSICTMHIQNLDRQTLDHINMADGVYKIRNTVSQFPSVLIGFSFARQDGSTKDTEIRQFYFSEALNPNEDIATPEYGATIADVIERAIVDVRLKDNTQATYEFLNLAGDIVQEISLVANQTYTHTQTEGALTWTINHNLGKFPSITITDLQGIVVEATVQYVDNNTIIATFTEATSGKAYLN